MVVATFSASQPWGTAATHQRENPGQWTPELIESTAAWSAVVRAIVQSQEELMQGVPGAEQAFARRCSEDAALRAHLDLVCERGLHDLLLSWIMEGIRERLAVHAVPSFWRHYREVVGGGAALRGKLSVPLQRRCQAAFFAAVKELAHFVGALVQLVAIVDGKQWHAAASFAASATFAPRGDEAPLPYPFAETAKCVDVTTLLQACVLAQAPDANTFSQWLTVCWQRSFADISRGGADGDEDEDEEGGIATWDDDEDDEEEEEANGDDNDGMVVDDRPLSPLPPAAEPVRRCCASLHQLAWMPLVEPTLSALLHAKLHASLEARCAKRFDERLLSRVLAWLRKGVIRWLRTVLMPTAPPDAPASASLQQWLARLRFFLMQSLATLRISELFDVIVDYPDSMPALADLKECLAHTHQHSDAVTSLAEAIDARLLKPGADTANIIQVYVSAIRALRQLDPSGVTLEAVSERVRTYLKARGDTIRQIVTSLTDPETSDLLEPAGGANGDAEPELLKDEGGVDAELCDVDIDELKSDEAAMLEWTPDPVQADPTRSSSRRTGDVLSILINIYGSRALFVNEFRSMLADKLLNASDYETDREVRNLELLKKRFGETALSSCETMLRDIADSKRVTRAVQRHFGDEHTQLLDATIVSRLCWPALSSEAFALPEPMAREMSRFEKQFMHHKAPRKLVWKPSLGCVTLDVAFADKTIKAVKCTPLHATILVTFGEQPKWTLSALAKKLKVDADVLKKRMIMWINRGFIHEAGRTADGDVMYEAPTHLGAGSEGRAQLGEEEDGGGAGGAAEAQLEQEMRVYEQYVIGMLTNLESLPLGRIHNMLRMFVPAQGADRGYDRSEAELQRFLNRLVEDGKLESSGGQFKIKRSG